jgi:hypothetical protein
MQVYMAMDPFDFRILAQNRPIDRALDLPRGAQGEGWPQRWVTVPDDEWRAMVTANLTPHAQDRIHIGWWNHAGGHWPDD